MYTINEDGTVTRNGGLHNSSSPQPSGGSDDNTGCWVTFIIVVVIGIIVFALVNKNEDSSSQEVAEEPAYEKVVDAEDANDVDTYISISSTSVSFDADGGYYTFTVNSNSSWNISTDTYEWGHLSKSGNQLTLRVDANNSSDSRTDYFVLSAGNETVRVDISQSGKEEAFLNVSPSEVSFTSSGGSKTIYIESNSDWIVSINTADWGHLSRSGDNLILQIDANYSSSSRTDYFCIMADDIEKKVHIIQEGTSPNNSITEVSGIIRSIWVDHNISDSYGNNGMKIHIKFDINGMLNRRGQAAAYFYYTNGNPLKDSNGRCSTPNGNVATHVDFTPNYENCTFNDLSIFMPYSELHMNKSASCYFTISLWCGDNEITQSEKTFFDISFE